VSRSYLLGLIGDGIDASLTPPMHEAEAQAHGLKLIYRTVDLTRLGLPAQDVGRLLRAGVELGFDAFNVTHPCKQVVLQHLDEVDEQAARIGAVNTVLLRDGRLLGSNTDAIGFARGLRHAIPDADLTHVVQIGAGGAGAAIAHALAGLGAQRLSIVDLDADRAAALAEGVRKPGLVVDTATPDDVPGLLGAGAGAAAGGAASSEAASSGAARATGLVNASPIGMHHHPGIPVQASLLRPDLWVADAVYRPTITQLIQAARALGAPTMEGGHMAVGQAAATFDLVTGRSADVTRMRDVFAQLVAAEEEAA